MPPVARTTGTGPVSHPDQRGQPARLEHAGHHQQVRARVDQMSQFLPVTDFEMAVLVVVEADLEVPEMAGDAVVIVGVADEHELAP